MSRAHAQLRWFRVGDQWCVILAGRSLDVIGWASGQLDMGPELAADVLRETIRTSD